MFKSQKFIILGVLIIVIISVFFLIMLDKKRDLKHNQNQIKKIILETYPLDMSQENVLENWQKEKSYGVIINK